MAEEQNGGRDPSRGNTPGESQHPQPPTGTGDARPTLPPVSAIAFSLFPIPHSQNRTQPIRGFPTLTPHQGNEYGPLLRPAPMLNPPNGYTPALQLPPPFAHLSPGYTDYYVHPRPPGQAGGSMYPPPPDPYHPAGYAGPCWPPSMLSGPPGPPYNSSMAEYHQQQQNVNGQPPPQAAPRQRTSIACRYCRKRKIRCSGYQNTSNGKCLNCDKLRIDCVFQPVASNSAAAFVPVSAVPGGVPPGTPLYGAYGQPLAPATGPTTHSYMHNHVYEYGIPYGPANYAYAPNPPPQASPPRLSPPLRPPSPQHLQQPQGRTGNGRRRPRDPDDDDEPARRLPPRNGYASDTTALRRASPVPISGSITPPRYNGHGHPSRGAESEPGAGTPTAQRNGGSHSPRTDIMSVEHLLGNHFPPRTPGLPNGTNDIDQHMLGRLNRRRSS